MGKAKKIGIIIVIAGFFAQGFELSFAQSSEESLGFSVWTIATYILGSIIILIIPTLIILLVLKRKGKLTSPTFKKTLKGIGLLFLGVFILGIAGAMSMSDEENAELDRQERIEEQYRLAEQAQKEKATQIKTSTALPSSCRGVNSMELDIYPTGKQCFAALNDRVEEWCLSQSKDCVAQFYLKLADTCADPILSSVDVCLMYTFKELYPKLIP